jgi:predicted nucleotidyltransferase
MFQKESDYSDFVNSAKRSLQDLASDGFSSIRLEVSGSLARGELSPPYSDLDLLLVAPKGTGASLRDHVPKLARSVSDLLAIFVDPFSSSGVFCSIYSGPLKVDWWVFEETEGSQRTTICRGNYPPPYNWALHCWDWTWWLWTKARRGKVELVMGDLPRLWLALTLKGIDPPKFPTSIQKTTTNEDLLELLRYTMGLLPASESPLAREIRHVIEAERK